MEGFARRPNLRNAPKRGPTVPARVLVESPGDNLPPPRRSASWLVGIAHCETFQANRTFRFQRLPESMEQLTQSLPLHLPPPDYPWASYCPNGKTTR